MDGCWDLAETDDGLAAEIQASFARTDNLHTGRAAMKRIATRILRCPKGRQPGEQVPGQDDEDLRYMTEPPAHVEIRLLPTAHVARIERFVNLNELTV